MRQLFMCTVLVALIGSWFHLAAPAIAEPEPPVKDPNLPGMWVGHSLADACPPGQVCAEWLQPGGTMDGAFCCVSEFEMSSNVYHESCEVFMGFDVVRPPGGGIL